MLPAALSEFVVSLIPDFDENKHEVDWNTVVKKGPKAGATLLWNLTSTKKKLNLFIQNFPYLSEQDFDWNTVATKGVHRGKSVLCNLASTPVGLNFLCSQISYLVRKNPNWNISCAHQGKSALWFLAASPEGRKLLRDNFDYFKSQKLDWNIFSKEGTHQGISVLWWLMSTPEGRKLLRDNFDYFKSQNLNWNIFPKEGAHQGKSVLWCLIASPEGLKFLRDNFDYFKSQNLNWNAPPKQGQYPRRSSLLSILTSTSEGLKFLRDNFDYFKSQELDWNTAPEQGQGISVLWRLVSTQEGRKLLSDYFSDYFKYQKLDLNAASAQDPNKGISVLWWLVSTPEGRMLLRDNFSYFKSQKLDLNAAPEQDQAPNKGISVLWWLAATPEGRMLLNDDYFINHFAKHEFRDTAPEQDPNKGISVLWRLVSTPEGRQFLKKLPHIFLSKDIINLNVHPPGQPSLLKHLLDAKDKSLIQWTLLCGASPFALDIPPAQQLELQQQTKNIWEKIRVAVRTIYRDLYEADHLKGDIKKLLCMTHLMQNHPELAFVTSTAFYQLIKNETEICLNEPFNIVATIAIRNFQQEKGIALILDRYNRDLFRETVVSVLKEYAEKEDSFENLLISEKTLRQSIANAIAKTNLGKNEIEKVIDTTLQQWRPVSPAIIQNVSTEQEEVTRPVATISPLKPSIGKNSFFNNTQPMQSKEMADAESAIKRKKMDTVPNNTLDIQKTLKQGKY